MVILHIIIIIKFLSYAINTINNIVKLNNIIKYGLSMKSDSKQGVRNTIHLTNVSVVLKPIEKRNKMQKTTRGNSVFLMGIILVLLIMSIYVSPASAISSSMLSKTHNMSNAEKICFGKPYPKINWSNCNLSHTEFHFSDMTGANLSGIITKNPLFYDVNLSGANLQNSVLSGGDFSYSNLSGADFRGADLRNIDFYHANLSGADLWVQTLLVQDL